MTSGIFDAGNDLDTEPRRAGCSIGVLQLSDSSRSRNPMNPLIWVRHVGYVAHSHQQLMKEMKMSTASGHTNAIRAKKVIGTDVKDTAGKSIGKVEDILLEKQSNNIMYAVVGFGGFLGMGEKYHPLPWQVLNYDDNQGAYVVNLTKEQLAAAPADSIEALTQADGIGYRDRVYDYYKTERYW
jgi:sporulation protein YlmC with PRC-barrel domain